MPTSNGNLTTLSQGSRYPRTFQQIQGSLGNANCFRYFVGVKLQNTVRDSNIDKVANVSMDSGRVSSSVTIVVAPTARVFVLSSFVMTMATIWMMRHFSRQKILTWGIVKVKAEKEYFLR